MQHKVESSGPYSRGARLRMVRLPVLQPTLCIALPGHTPSFSIMPFAMLVGHNVKLKQAKKNKFVFLSKEIN